MTSERLGEMFKGDSADMCAGKFPLVSMGGRADMSSVRRRGARTPIGTSGNLLKFLFNINFCKSSQIIIKIYYYQIQIHKSHMYIDFREFAVRFILYCLIRAYPRPGIHILTREKLFENGS